MSTVYHIYLKKSMVKHACETEICPAPVLRLIHVSNKNTGFPEPHFVVKQRGGEGSPVFLWFHNMSEALVLAQISVQQLMLLAL